MYYTLYVTSYNMKTIGSHLACGIDNHNTENPAQIRKNAMNMKNLLVHTNQVHRLMHRYSHEDGPIEQGRQKYLIDLTQLLPAHILSWFSLDSFQKTCNCLMILFHMEYELKAMHMNITLFQIKNNGTNQFIFMIQYLTVKA